MLKPESRYVPLTGRIARFSTSTFPADHYLRRFKAGRRFRPIPFRSSWPITIPTLGRPPIEPVLLLKLEFLQYQYDLSDREVISHSQVNMAFRLFLDLSLHSPLPDPSLLSLLPQAVGSPRCISRSSRI